MVAFVVFELCRGLVLAFAIGFLLRNIARR